MRQLWMFSIPIGLQDKPHENKSRSNISCPIGEICDGCELQMHTMLGTMLMMTYTIL